MGKLKTITIIGGGISGLATLHYLKSHLTNNSSINIKLIERSNIVGGTVNSQKTEHGFFEKGPNAFLDYDDDTISLIRDLGLEMDVLVANEASNTRYISINNKLIKLPKSPVSFITFPVLSIAAKSRIFKEYFINDSSRDTDTIRQFIDTRLGVQVSKYLVDPMVSGIHGGDIDQLNFKLCFPRMFDSIKKNGSLIKGLLNKDKSKKRPVLKTLLEGMGTLPHAIASKHHQHLHLDETVQSICKNDDGYIVQTNKNKYPSDVVVISTPAYFAGSILGGLNEKISELLNKINYVPIAVVGLVYERSHLPKFPEGFGFLVPSSEGKKLLGVLFEDQIFPERYDDALINLRVMIGGAHNCDIANMSKDQLLNIAEKEIEAHFNPIGSPIEDSFKLWPKAIPQYTNEYVKIIEQVEALIKEFDGIHIVSNFYKGVSFNDCIKNASNTAKDIIKSLSVH